MLTATLPHNAMSALTPHRPSDAQRPAAGSKPFSAVITRSEADVVLASGFALPVASPARRVSAYAAIGALTSPGRTLSFPGLLVNERV
ncbi:MAG: hypothetical protein VX663_06455 [Pseudomonadota bacterium]|nr:hypothetical protein [Pseudomonadota bacterium]